MPWNHEGKVVADTFAHPKPCSHAKARRKVHTRLVYGWRIEIGTAGSVTVGDNIEGMGHELFLGRTANPQPSGKPLGAKGQLPTDGRPAR